jgi:hypothetical protein
MDRLDSRSQAVGEVQPVDAFLEERISSGHCLVITPVFGGLQSQCDCHEVREHELTHRVFRKEPP